MRLLTVTPEPDAPLETVQHLLLDQVLPYVLALRGEVVLHASGSVIDGTGVAFLGPSGMGKSTLATALGQRGHPVLTDDCAVVHWEGDQVLIEPSYPGLRLWPASVENLLADDDTELTPMAHYSTKVRAVPESVTFAEDAVPFAGALVITNSPDDDPGLVAITPLSPGAAAFEVVESAFVLAEGPEDKAAIFDRYTALAGAVPVARITVPNDFSRLPAVCDAVEAWARSLTATATATAAAPTKGPTAA